MQHTTRNPHAPQVRASIALVEKEMGKKFADPDNTLLLSVRSGAAVSVGAQAARLAPAAVASCCCMQPPCATALRLPINHRLPSPFPNTPHHARTHLNKHRSCPCPE